MNRLRAPVLRHRLVQLAADAALAALAFYLAFLYQVNWLVFGPVLLLTFLMLRAAVGLYRFNGPAALPRMSGLIEAAALLTSLGWLAGATLQ